MQNTPRCSDLRRWRDIIKLWSEAMSLELERNQNVMIQNQAPKFPLYVGRRAALLSLHTIYHLLESKQVASDTSCWSRNSSINHLSSNKAEYLYPCSDFCWVANLKKKHGGHKSWGTSHKAKMNIGYTCVCKMYVIQDLVITSMKSLRNCTDINPRSDVEAYPHWNSPETRRKQQNELKRKIQFLAVFAALNN